MKQMTAADKELADHLWREIADVASPKRRATSPTHKIVFCQILKCTEPELMRAARILNNRGDVTAIDLGDTIAFAMQKEPPEQAQIDFTRAANRAVEGRLGQCSFTVRRAFPAVR
ncbi:hypothetical protein PQR75_46870 [Paraburkholderia fungorum]|uniref:hypothetical protein n=1 Tax=Paraburkholderia fungorum TaxID=134537 RepID=UPI0038BA922E